MVLHKKKVSFYFLLRVTFLLSSILFCNRTQAQFNQLWIPDTISGTVFNLSLQDTFKQFLPGQQTITEAVNGNWWGPTLIFNKGDTVHLNVSNNLADTTTMHWHGLHIPARMDGGPHQTIAPMNTWSPEFKVMNNAATYWYHPHLHMMTERQVTMGLGGMIIVRDNIEASLNLPRNYGIDDIPLALTDRRFDSLSNQLVMSHYGDTMTINGTLNPEITLPAQVVRFRILNGAMERSYRFGFNDTRTFYIITSDGGLLNAPVPVVRYSLAPGERVEILVNLSGQQGQTCELKAFNGSLPPDVGGSQPGSGIFANQLGGRTFNLLHINVGMQTINPVTSIPGILTTNNFWPDTTANVTRHIIMSDAPNCPPGMNGCAWLDSTLFDINEINQTVLLNNTEIWELQNLSIHAHPFHIHGVQFKILDYNGTNAPAYEQGWKDIVMVRSNTTARVITRFEDYADDSMPYMYHCHIMFHEDFGMMGQFLVVDSLASVPPPDISYTVSDSVLCINDCVQFNATSTTNVDTWEWHFPGGDPDTSSLQNPTVCYQQGGIFDVTLIASNSGGKDSIQSTGRINASNCVAPPDITYTVSDSILCLNDCIQFNATSTGNVDTWEWHFPGGNPDTSSLQNPVVCYQQAGTFDVSLKATNAGGQDSIFASGQINSSNCVLPPDISFSASDSILCTLDCIQFTANSSTNVDTWEWHFTGATPDTSSLQNPSVCYLQSGTYDVILIAYNAGGQDSIQAMGLITSSICIGLNDQNKNDAVKLYPNPANDYTWIAYSGKSAYELYLTSLDGKMLFQKNIDATTYRLDLGEMNCGIYFVKIVTQDGVYVNKIEKQ